LKSQQLQVHQLEGVLWTPDDLNRRYVQQGRQLDYSGPAVCVTLPQSVWRQFNAPSRQREAFAALIQSDTTRASYLALIAQVGAQQLVPIVPLSSTMARNWYQEALDGGGEFRLVITIEETGQVAMLGIQYEPTAEAAEMTQATLAHIEATPMIHDPGQHLEDIRRAVAAMSGAGSELSIVPGVSVQERWVIPVGAADWPPVETGVGVRGRESGGGGKDVTVRH
jgi:hypothetical protein